MPVLGVPKPISIKSHPWGGTNSGLPQVTLRSLRITRAALRGDRPDGIARLMSRILARVLTASTKLGLLLIGLWLAGTLLRALGVLDGSLSGPPE